MLFLYGTHRCSTRSEPRFSLRSRTGSTWGLNPRPIVTKAGVAKRKSDAPLSPEGGRRTRRPNEDPKALMGQSLQFACGEVLWSNQDGFRDLLRTH
jgi:hypothetical protein